MERKEMEKKTPHSWRVISLVRIRHKSEATFDKNQKVQPKT